MLTSLGSWRFQGLPDAIVLYQVGAEGLASHFPPLRSGVAADPLPPVIGGWETFFAAQAGASAALAGLVFVALSINLRDILEHPGLLTGRAAEAIILMVQPVFVGLVVLIPNQGMRTLGFELLILGGFTFLFVNALIWRTFEPRGSGPARVRAAGARRGRAAADDHRRRAADRRLDHRPRLAGVRRPDVPRRRHHRCLGVAGRDPAVAAADQQHDPRAGAVRAVGAEAGLLQDDAGGPWSARTVVIRTPSRDSTVRASSAHPDHVADRIAGARTGAWLPAASSTMTEQSPTASTGPSSQGATRRRLGGGSAGGRHHRGQLDELVKPQRWLDVHREHPRDRDGRLARHGRRSSTAAAAGRGMARAAPPRRTPPTGPSRPLGERPAPPADRARGR